MKEHELLGWRVNVPARRTDATGGLSKDGYQESRLWLHSSFTATTEDAVRSLDLNV